MTLFGGTFGSGAASTPVFGNAAAPAVSGTATISTAPASIDPTVEPAPQDTVSALQFSPPVIPQIYLAAGGWDCNLYCWEISQSGQAIPKAMQNHQAPILDISWSDDGTKIFAGGCDRTAKMWDLASNTYVQIGQHDAAVKTVHWIKAQSYACLMTGSFDKTLRFWDGRTPQPSRVINLEERVYCADVQFPMAVVGLANHHIIVYDLRNGPVEYKKITEPPLKYQYRAIAIMNDKKTNQPHGFAVGSIEGRVAIQYLDPAQAKDNFTFKCHRSQVQPATNVQDIFAVNGICFHPVHYTFATIGSDGRYSFWDKDSRTRLKTSDEMDQPISACTVDPRGHVFAYAVGYDWSKGHEGNDPNKKPRIHLHPCFDELNPKKKS